MATKDHGPTIKDDEQYQRLREEGMNKQKAARIANTSRQAAGKRGGEAPPYEEWTKKQLYEKAVQVGIQGRSKLNKDELIKSLRRGR